MKLLLPILSLAFVSTMALADQVEMRHILSCKGGEEYGVSLIQILRDGDGPLAAFVVSSQDYSFYSVEAWGENQFHFKANAGDFLLKKSWTGKWNLAKTDAEQNLFIELKCD